MGVPELLAQAHHHYLAYFRAIDGYNCGHALAQHINQDVFEHALNFDEAMDQLAVTNQNVPKMRLLVKTKG